jgi:NAD(P)H-hydrate epimerase
MRADPASSAAHAPLPTVDPLLAEPGLDLAALARRWAARAALSAISAEQMRGLDVRAQRNGVTGERLMEEAGAAVAASCRALLATTERGEHLGPVLILCGPGNNGGDGTVAARYLARAGVRSAVVLVATETRPTTVDGARNWDRLEGVAAVARIHAATARDVALVGAGVERAALVVDALLGTGVRGPLRDPIRAAVDLCARARSAGVPVLAVDCPTSIDLTSGEPSDPVVRADVTVTFHRPKHGLGTRVGAALAGRVLVAPIGIPHVVDPV